MYIIRNLRNWLISVVISIGFTYGFYNFLIWEHAMLIILVGNIIQNYRHRRAISNEISLFRSEMAEKLKEINSLQQKTRIQINENDIVLRDAIYDLGKKKL